VLGGNLLVLSSRVNRSEMILPTYPA